MPLPSCHVLYQWDPVIVTAATQADGLGVSIGTVYAA